MISEQRHSAQEPHGREFLGRRLALVGHVAIEWGTRGMPERCEPAGGHGFCRFRTSYGHTANAQAYGTSYATASAHEMYDQIDAEFDSDGTLRTWRAFVQR